MSNTITTAAKPTGKQATIKALQAKLQATAAEVVQAAGIGRSTATRLLARMEQTGRASRSAGGRDGRRQLPDRWRLTTSEPAPEIGAASTSAGVAGGQAGEQRLRAGELDGLILAYLGQHPGEPAGPSMIAKALQKSAGATANALVRLARAGQMRQVGERPLRYQLTA